MTTSAAAPLASVAIINYNGARFLPELLESLAEQSFSEYELVVVDNASSDASLSIIRKMAPQASIIEPGRNIGFGGAANIAAFRALGRYLVLLNPDIRLESGWLAHLVETAEAHPRAAAVACKLLLYDRPSVINGVGGCMNRLGYSWDRGYGEEDQGQFDDPADVLFASAGAALFRRQVFLDAGGFDERFFMYHEDVDLGWRFWLLGYRVLTAPSARALHHFGGTTRAEKSLSWRERLGERHNIRALIKNYETDSLRRALWQLLRLRQRPSRKLAQLGNFGWNLWWLVDTMGQRRRIQQRRQVSDQELKTLIVQSQDVPVRL